MPRERSEKPGTRIGDPGSVFFLFLYCREMTTPHTTGFLVRPGLRKRAQEAVTGRTDTDIKASKGKKTSGSQSSW